MSTRLVKRESVKMLVSKDIGPALLARSRNVTSAALAGAPVVLMAEVSELALKNSRYTATRSPPATSTPRTILVFVEMVGVFIVWQFSYYWSQ
jgi:hypothetical protein